MLIPSIFISLEFTVQEFILALKILNFVQRRYIFMYESTFDFNLVFTSNDGPCNCDNDGTC